MLPVPFLFLMSDNTAGVFVAFHYRLLTDPDCERQGSWKVFYKRTAASVWLSDRSRKTATSPKGALVLSAGAVRNYYDALLPIEDRAPSLVKALKSYIDYCDKYENKKLSK